MKTVYYQHARDLASRLVANEAVIVRPATGEMTVLNEAASVLWAAADGTRSAVDLAKVLKQAYGLEQAPEIQAFLDDLVARRLLEPQDAPAPAACVRLPAPVPSAYALPGVVACEPLETLAATCASGWEGLGPCNPQAWGACPDPWD